MIDKRHASERGRTDLGWLDSQHGFSFGSYFDPKNTGFRALRVLNDDRIEPGKGFGTHPHQDMEIISWVISGAIEHRDGMGNGSVLRPGEAQRMTAGTGITHSEFNPSKAEPLHLLQIWLLPESPGLEPGYEQREFPLEARRGELVLIASRDARDGSLLVNQDVELWGGRLSAGDEVHHELAEGRHGWIQVARGAVKLNGVRLDTGDAAAVSQERELIVESENDSELLLFDLA